MNYNYRTNDGVEHDITTWQDSDGWWSCVSGTYRGIYSESDDFGPFAAENEAKAWAEDYIDEHSKPKVEIEIDGNVVYQA